MFFPHTIAAININSMKWACFLLILSSFFCVACSKKRQIAIGVLFDSPNRDLQGALRDAVDRLNADLMLTNDVYLDWITAHSEAGNSHQAAKLVCTLLKTGIGVMIGPQSTTSSSRVQAICNSLQVPHIEMVEDFRMHKTDSSVNMAPHPRSLSKAYASLIERWPWYEEFAVVFEDANDLSRIQDMLQLNDRRMHFYQLEKMGDHRILLKTIKTKGLTCIVLAVKIELVAILFEMAEEIGLISEYYDYVIPNLDVHTVNFEKYYNRTVNITGFQLIDSTANEFHDILQHWRFSGYKSSLTDISAPEQTVKTEVALLYDAILLYARAISNLGNGSELHYPTPSCEDEFATHSNNVVVEKLKSMNINGLTGPIKFNSYGQRTDFTLNVIKLMYVGKPGFKKIATWSASKGYVQILTRSQLEKATDHSLSLIKLKVTTFLNEPFFMEIPESKRSAGGPIYEGYIVDLMEALSTVVNLTFEIRPVADKHYGAKNEDGSWSGMVGELISKKADVCAADLTITQKRQEVVDFTIPFMQLGISILYKKSDKLALSLFSFLNPLSDEVWIYMTTAYLGVSILLFTLARLTPHEWTNPHPLDPKPSELKNTFDLSNSLWCTIGALMLQGSDLVPRAVSTRLLTGIWWFFTLIMMKSYTASLAAFLTSAQIAAPISSAADLARQTKIKYGTVKDGATQNFFEQSTSETYRKMWIFMDSTEPTVFVNNNDEGIVRVKRGEFAFFMESTVIEYRTSRDCELMQIGSLLDSKGYGIATPKNSPHRDRINRGVLALQDAGILLTLKRRWWKQKGLNQDCSFEAPAAMELGITNVGGVFVLLFSGLALACVIGAVEFIWNTRRNVVDQAMFRNELLREMKFALSFRKSTRPLLKGIELQDVHENTQHSRKVGIGTTVV